MGTPFGLGSLNRRWLFSCRRSHVPSCGNNSCFDSRFLFYRYKGGCGSIRCACLRDACHRDACRPAAVDVRQPRSTAVARLLELTWIGTSHADAGSVGKARQTDQNESRARPGHSTSWPARAVAFEARKLADLVPARSRGLLSGAPQLVAGSSKEEPPRDRCRDVP